MTTRSRCALFLLVGCLVTGGVVTAQDWPQFLGPTRNGTYSGVSLAATWPEDGPTRLWQRSVGAGFAGPAVVGDRVILFHRVGGDEVVEALAAESGETVWRYAYPTTYRDDLGFDEGPRSVPVVADGRVHTYGAQGQLHTVDLETGAALWHVDTHARYAVRKGFFGAAGSPLVEEGRLIANVGGGQGGIVAFDAASGDELWTATSDESSYSSPVGATFGGRRHALVFTRNGLVGLDPASGDVLFEKRWRSRSGSSVNAATPLVDGKHFSLVQLPDRRHVAPGRRDDAGGGMGGRREYDESLCDGGDS